MTVKELLESSGAQRIMREAEVTHAAVRHYQAAVDQLAQEDSPEGELLRRALAGPHAYVAQMQAAIEELPEGAARILRTGLPAIPDVPDPSDLVPVVPSLPDTPRA